MDINNNYSEILKNSCVNHNILESLHNYSLKQIKYMKGQTHCHFAVIFNNKGTIITYGYNNFRRGLTVHAEVDAINNLPPATTKKSRLKKISILVIRLSKKEHRITDSKCCVRCCESIYKIPALRGYTIESVHYSNNNGYIEDHHPIELLIEPEYHLSVYYTKRGYKPRIRERVLSNPDKRVKMFIRKIDSD